MEYLARLCAITALVLVALVVVAVHLGQVAGASAAGVTSDFTNVNRLFRERVDFTAPAKARTQLQTLTGTLTRLDDAASDDVEILVATLPDVERLLHAGRGDVGIANQLTGVAQSLLGAGQSLRRVAIDADSTANALSREVDQANNSVTDLNRILAEIGAKLDVLPPAPVQKDSPTDSQPYLPMLTRTEGH